MPKKLARQLVVTDKLIFMLDGLDEVAEAWRSRCVNFINAFVEHNPERQVVVCSRTADYDSLAEQLDMHYAIEMQSLTPGF